MGETVTREFPKRRPPPRTVKSVQMIAANAHSELPRTTMGLINPSQPNDSPLIPDCGQRVVQITCSCTSTGKQRSQEPRRTFESARGSSCLHTWRPGLDTTFLLNGNGAGNVLGAEQSSFSVSLEGVMYRRISYSFLRLCCTIDEDIVEKDMDGARGSVGKEVFEWPLRKRERGICWCHLSLYKKGGRGGCISHALQKTGKYSCECPRN